MTLTEEYILTELKKFTSTHKDYGLIITERNAERFAEDLVKNCSIPDVVGQSEQLKAFREWTRENLDEKDIVTKKAVDSYLESL